jgi:hypothetical protein
MENKKIYFSILNNGWISSELAIRLPRWIMESPYQVIFEESSLRPIENNRNSIVKRFLATDCTHLIQIDNDTVPIQNPIKLVDVDVDIIACAVPIMQSGILYFNSYRLEQLSDVVYKPVSYLKDEIRKTTLEEVDAIGTGCFAVKRKVYETIQCPFKRLYDIDGIETLGSDLYFSEQSRNAGFKLFTHFGFIAKHIKQLDLLSLS